MYELCDYEDPAFAYAHPQPGITLTTSANANDLYQDVKEVFQLKMRTTYMPNGTSS